MNIQTATSVLISLFLVAMPAAPGYVHADTPAAAPASGATSTQVLEALQAGNNRFVKGQGRAENHVVTRQKLVAGQAPEAIVLSCSDSRVPPEIVFDQDLGDLFVVRVAGNVIDPAVMASIEYAVAHLGPKLIVVLGHSHCGAVKAALTTPQGQSAGSADLDQLVGSIQNNLKGKSFPSPKEDPSLKAAVEAQAQAVARQLPARSAIVGDAVKKGNLRIVSGVYDLGSGEVKFNQE